MCGIVGILAKNEQGKEKFALMQDAVATLHRRGPDAQQIVQYENAAFGHARLAVIDPSEGAAQPFVSEDGRYVLVFNGEIYNYRQLQAELEHKGQLFKTTSDTEVLLYHLIQKGLQGVNELNGFFAFAFYDLAEDVCLLVRDRFGIKPLYWMDQKNEVLFASEMKSILALNPSKQLSSDAISLYFKFNYQPSNLSMIEGAKQLDPGSYIKFHNGNTVEASSYYKLPERLGRSHDSYDKAQAEVRRLLEQSVERRMVSDVPLGCFLSGGIDSSIITALASKSKPDLQTFSVGFKDEKLFDETHYAKLVADRYKTHHTVIELSNDDLYAELDDFLDYNCDPFADSSALAVNLLCKHTREKLTVALSGDGADELFSGYNKHMAEYLMRTGGLKQSLAKGLSPLTALMPQSRNSKWGNLGRQLNKFGSGSKLSAQDRYWEWAGWKEDKGVNEMLLSRPNMEVLREKFQQQIKSEQDMNEVLRADFGHVLHGDMLTKVDRYSMANSLEVRVPFLDHELVDYVFSLPASYKIQKGMKKRLLQDTFRSDLPEELYRRPKHGFEVPLLKWFKGPLKSKIETEYLHKDWLKEQALFDPVAVDHLMITLNSAQPGDSVAQVWALIVFQHWFKKYFVS